MIEILFICLVVWIIYAWRTGKFKKEYQDKNNAELKQAWTDLKSSFKQKNDKSVFISENKREDGSTDFAFEKSFRIAYKSAGDKITVRDIDIVELQKNKFNDETFYYLDAYCFEVKADRTFRVDRIIELYDYQTSFKYSNYNEILKFLRGFENL